MAVYPTSFGVLNETDVIVAPDEMIEAELRGLELLQSIVKDASKWKEMDCPVSGKSSCPPQPTATNFELM